MGRTRVKICGITNLDDASQAASLGADALGFVLHKESARYITVDQLGQFFPDLPPFTQRVGLFVNEDPVTVAEVLKAVPFDLLQFHGDETAGYCESFGVPYIKVLRATSRQDILDQVSGYPSAAGILLDSVSNGQFGGTGTTFQWSMIPALDKPLILAGGLNANNVSQAIETIRPYAVDLSGGVEAHKGVKDHGKLEQFFNAVQAADMTQRESGQT